MASPKQQILNAIAKYGPSVDHIAAQYTNPVTGRPLTGKALLAKLLQGESSALSDPEAAGRAVSGAGAKAWGQFMPDSRRTAIEKFGVDPWADPDQAVHATALHLRGKINGSTGLKGYNPGDPSYTNYILNQKVGHLAGDVLTRPGGGAKASGGGGGGATASAIGARMATVQTSAPSGFADAGSSLASALELATKPMGAPSQPIAAPAFAAAPVLPAGYGQPVQSGGPAPAAELQLPDPTVAELPGPGTSTVVPGDGVGIVGAQATPGQAASTSRAGRGKVVVAPGAERDGHGLQKPILGLLRDVSAASGRDVTVTTGTNHSQFVVNTKRQSDHWVGNAADLGVGGDARQDKAVGKKGDLIAAHAIQVASQRAGDGMTFAAALKLAKRGGVFNFETPQGRVQVLWRTLVGGDHFNHVHVGLAPGR